MRRLTGSLVLALLTALTAAVGLAQEDEDPDLAFLEYLGSWQESDEEWVVAAEMGPQPGPPVEGKPEAQDKEEEAEDE